jgi:hypothetical protein
MRGSTCFRYASGSMFIQLRRADQAVNRGGTSTAGIRNRRTDSSSGPNAIARKSALPHCCPSRHRHRFSRQRLDLSLPRSQFEVLSQKKSLQRVPIESIEVRQCFFAFWLVLSSHTLTISQAIFKRMKMWPATTPSIPCSRRGDLVCRASANEKPGRRLLRALVRFVQQRLRAATSPRPPADAPTSTGGAADSRTRRFDQPLFSTRSPE